MVAGMQAWGRLAGLLTRVGVLIVMGSVVVVAYQSNSGLALRSQLGQTSGSFLHALNLYEGGRVGEAIGVIEPLVVSGYPAALNLLCGLVNGRDPVSFSLNECVALMEESPPQRLMSLTELAIWAQEWRVADHLLDRRVEAGDVTAHFDRARLIQLAPPGHFETDALPKALTASALARDPRGQYAVVLQTLDGTSAGALRPVLVEILSRKPKLRPADAYFELAKLMQTGAVSSDLSYVEVLKRADAGGNAHAARYLAQYYLGNPQQDPAGVATVEWLEKAAAQGDPVAQYNLALIMMQDSADEDAQRQAIAQLDRSAAAGFGPALNLLGATLWSKPELASSDTAAVTSRAVELMEAAAAKNDVDALFNLGNIALSTGDRSRALDHLRRAAILGSEPARALIGRLDAEVE